jgi:hypothetical protein
MCRIEQGYEVTNQPASCLQVATKWVHTKKVYLDRAAEIETEKKKVQQQQENQA